MSPSEHPSDSREQRAAEGVLLEGVSQLLGTQLRPEKILLRSGVAADVDGFNRDARLMCEVYAHVGDLKGAQVHKVAKDILKMITLERELGGEWRKILCLADESAARKLRGRSWLALACETFNVQVAVVQLSPDLQSMVLAAQQRQVMTNLS